MCDIVDALFRPINLVVFEPMQRLADLVGCSLHQIPLDVACITAACSERNTLHSDFLLQISSQHRLVSDM